MYNSEIN